MGYYSDVCLVLSAKGLEDLNCRIEAMDKDLRLAVVNLLDCCDKYEEHEGVSIHFWKSVKWYLSDKDICALMDALSGMDESRYRYKEVGEDGEAEDIGDLCSVFLPLVTHSITYTSMKPEPPKQYASVGWTVEDLTYMYGIHEDKARDILLDIWEELHRAMWRAGWEVIDAAMNEPKN